MEAVFGFLIAVLIGMTGAGGGSLAVPVLVLALGVPTVEAVGTSLLFATVVKLVSAPAYVWRRQSSGRALVRLLAGGLPGVAAGALVLNGMQSRRLEHVVMAVVGGTIAVLAIASLCRMRRPQTEPRRDRSRWLPWVALPIGLEVGFSASGAGALGSVALMSLTPLAAPAVVGTDLLFGLGLSSAGSGLHLALGKVNVPVAAQMLAGGVVGALVGPWLAMRAPVRLMRAGLSVLLSILGGQLFWRGLAP